MNIDERLELQKMISVNGTTDQTNLIRQLKHSDILRYEINKLIELKAQYIDDVEKINLEGMVECSFLNTYYNDIYNRLRKDELNIDILFQFLDVLKNIEEEKIDQHEGSFKVGKLLKEIYVDSALRKAKKLDELYPNDKELENKGIDINWKTFKQSHKN
jgi:hypothetical protein